ncbi:DUF2795 domain-containing protein [Microbacterium sp.]|jgi:hypothetical protein|uniref:DUF2795 domain-containing protein n=1 Tax=Microbacterium sp. TaxID=51671 RepID=UPI00260F0F89|nr:DUF2795 domain-containing protein [uncultured Microbacterium sp.]
MTTSASALDRFLADMEYPAITDDLVREASRDGLPSDDIAALSALPIGRFDSCFDVRRAMTPARAHALAAA